MTRGDSRLERCFARPSLASSRSTSELSRQPRVVIALGTMGTPAVSGQQRRAPLTPPPIGRPLLVEEANAWLARKPRVSRSRFSNLAPRERLPERAGKGRERPGQTDSAPRFESVWRISIPSTKSSSLCRKRTSPVLRPPASLPQRLPRAVDVVTPERYLVTLQHQVTAWSA